MRRPAVYGVDGLETLLRMLLEIRGVGPLLPAVAVAIVVYLGLQPEYAAQMGELQRLLEISQQRTSQLCHSLARKGLVRLTQSSQDRRSAIRLRQETGKCCLRYCLWSWNAS
jgi:DNA-binding MarR family transcriptional regulator